MGLLPPSRRPHLLPVTSSTQPAESGLSHLPWRSLTCPHCWGRALQPSAPSQDDALATRKDFIDDGVTTTMRLDDDVPVTRELNDDVLVTKEGVSDAVATPDLLLLLQGDTSTTPLSDPGVLLLRCLLLATMTTTQRRRGGMVTTMKAHVALSLGPLDPVPGSLLNDDVPTLRRLIGDARGLLLRFPL